MNWPDYRIQMKERGSTRETLCGLGPWRPSFLQPLASKKMYMFFYGALGIVKVCTVYF
jgi:hypothetical protein